MVKVTVQGLHLEITESLEQHVQEQVGKFVENFEAVIVEDVSVSLGVDSHHSHLNTVTIKVPVKGNDVVVEGHDADMYKAITATAQKAGRSVRKIKEKAQHRKGKDKRHIVADDDDSEE